MKVKMTLIEDMLGTCPSNASVFGDFVATKNPDGPGEEFNLPENVEQRGTTVFQRDPATGQLMLRDYVIKGMLKGRGDAIRARKGKEDKGSWGAIRGKIDEDVHIFPRNILLGKTQADGMLERPLRAQTAQGPRVSVCASEVVKAGTSFACEIRLVSGRVTEKMLDEIFEQCELVGLGQWRNAGYGRVKIEKIG